MSKRNLVLLNSLFFVLAFISVFALLRYFVATAYPLAELLVSINLASFLLFGFDKSQATYKSATRLPEEFFYLVAAIGGSIGILAGVQAFRHKTKKVSFTGTIVFILMVQLILGYWKLK